MPALPQPGLLANNTNDDRAINCYRFLGIGSLPYVVVMAPSTFATLGNIPLNESMRAYLFSSLASPSLPSWAPYSLQGVVEIGDANRSAPSTLSYISPRAATLMRVRTPATGIRNISFGLLLSNPQAYLTQVQGVSNFDFTSSTIAQGDLTFVLQRANMSAVAPMTDGETDSLKNEWQLVRWRAVVVVSNSQSNASMTSLGAMLGRGGAVVRVGWLVTQPVLLRDYAAVPDCSTATLSTLLARISGSISGLPSYLLNATCALLGPGAALRLAQKTSASDAATAAQIAPCLDARVQVRLVLLLLSRVVCRAMAARRGASPTPSSRATPRPQVNVTLTYTGANGTSPADSELTGAQSVLAAGVAYAMATYYTAGNATSYYCAPSSQVAVSTLGNVSAQYITVRDWDSTMPSCAQQVQTALTLMQRLVAATGANVTMLGSSVACQGDYNCIDCWPYDITILQCILMVCGLMLVVVLLYALRLRALCYSEARRPAPPGVLDIHRIAAGVHTRQRQQQMLPPSTEGDEPSWPGAQLVRRFLPFT